VLLCVYPSSLLRASIFVATINHIIINAVATYKISILCNFHCLMLSCVDAVVGCANNTGLMLLV